MIVNRLRDRDSSPRHVGVQPFDHPAITLPPLPLRRVEYLDHFARPFHLGRR
jgi:hypothetical protein